MIKSIYIAIYTVIFAALVPTMTLAESFDYRFDVLLGLAKIGEMQVAANSDGKSYSVATALYTTGLVGAVYDVRYDQSAIGRISAGGALVPIMHIATHDEKGKISRLEILFSGDRVSRVAFDPAKSVPSEVTTYRNTVDPMSLMYFLLRPVGATKVCSGEVVMFDGRKRSTVRFTKIKRYSDGRVECNISYSGNGGRGGIALSALVFRPDNNDLMRIQKFEAHTSLGTLTIKAR
ncbi:hypothetical protein A9Q96_16340 [Rhodobacterales bacterium 52_120_T64]|nr:hypothetical protein A9Q96_16340 [Rhodobacterales bacterium 52_120_T64]